MRMKRYVVSSENGPTIRTWARSERNARFSYAMMYSNCGIVSCGKISAVRDADAD